jgi:hypothetical protein
MRAFALRAISNLPFAAEKMTASELISLAMAHSAALPDAINVTFSLDRCCGLLLILSARSFAGKRGFCLTKALAIALVVSLRPVVACCGSALKLLFMFDWSAYEDTDSSSAGCNRAGSNRNDCFSGRDGSSPGRRPRRGYRAL